MLADGGKNGLEGGLAVLEGALEDGQGHGMMEVHDIDRISQNVSICCVSADFSSQQKWGKRRKSADWDGGTARRPMSTRHEIEDGRTTGIQLEKGRCIKTTTTTIVWAADGIDMNKALWELWVLENTRVKPP
jgi:hypothetical protein